MLWELVDDLPIFHKNGTCWMVCVRFSKKKCSSHFCSGCTMNFFPHFFCSWESWKPHWGLSQLFMLNQLLFHYLFRTERMWYCIVFIETMVAQWQKQPFYKKGWYITSWCWERDHHGASSRAMYRMAIQACELMFLWLNLPMTMMVDAVGSAQVHGKSRNATTS